jgi:hypothetical protein
MNRTSLQTNENASLEIEWWQECEKSAKARLRDIEHRIKWLKEFNATHDNCLASRVPEALQDRILAEGRLQNIRQQLQTLQPKEVRL